MVSKYLFVERYKSYKVKCFIYIKKCTTTSIYIFCQFTCKKLLAYNHKCIFKHVTIYEPHFQFVTLFMAVDSAKGQDH